MSDARMAWVSGEELFGSVSMADAIRAIQHDLREGLDPGHDLARVIDVLDHGQLLYMPSRFGEFVGAKVSTVAPENPAKGLERIHGVYVLMDATTLVPVAFLDGQALTALRTPAVSAAAADFLAPERIDHLVVFGAGTQAWGHVAAMRAIRAIDTVSIVARDPGHRGALVERLVAEGVRARHGSPADVSSAQVIVCATTARTPLFDGATVLADACVIAVGSHEVDARELDGTMMGRAQVVVEDPEVALREAGDVVMAVAEGYVTGSTLVAMRDVVTGAVAVDHARPRIFKSTGMPWEDLVVAVACYRTRLAAGER